MRVGHLWSGTDTPTRPAASTTVSQIRRGSGTPCGDRSRAVAAERCLEGQRQTGALGAADGQRDLGLRGVGRRASVGGQGGTLGQRLAAGLVLGDLVQGDGWCRHVEHEAITRTEIEALIAEGVACVQLDTGLRRLFVRVRLVSSKSPELETIDELQERIDAATQIIDWNDLALSPQCGFASVAEGGNHLTADEQYAKLQLVSDTALATWGIEL